MIRGSLSLKRIKDLSIRNKEKGELTRLRHQFRLIEPFAPCDLLDDLNFFYEVAKTKLI